MKKGEAFLKNRFIILIFLMISILNINAQKKFHTTERSYSNGVLLAGIYDMEQKKFFRDLEPKGKNVSIKYDPFFNKYTIDWINEVGEQCHFNLKFSEENSGGMMYINTSSSSNNFPFFIDDTIENGEKGNLTLTSAVTLPFENRQVRFIFMFVDLK